MEERANERKEFESRVARIREAMIEEDLDLFLLHSPTRGHARYASNYPTPFPWTHYCHAVPGAFISTDSALVVMPLEGDPSLVISPYLPAFLLADQYSWIRDINRAENLAEVCRKVVTKRGLPHKKIGIAGDEMPQFLYRGLVEGFSASKFKFISERIELIRSVKSEMEIGFLRIAAKMADDVWETIKQTAKPGKKLYEVTAATEYTVKSQKAEKFAIFLSTGALATRGLGIPPSDAVIQKNDILITEISPKYEGYFTQICRVAVFGKPSQKQKDVFNTVVRAKEAAIAKAKPGVTVSEMAHAGFRVIEESGYAEYCAMRIGHGLGLDMTEIPYGIQKGDLLKLQPGMTMTVHPALHVLNVAGAMCGEHILITEKGAEQLSHSKDELVEL